MSDNYHFEGIWERSHIFCSIWIFIDYTNYVVFSIAFIPFVCISTLPELVDYHHHQLSVLWLLWRFLIS